MGPHPLISCLKKLYLFAAPQNILPTFMRVRLESLVVAFLLLLSGVVVGVIIHRVFRTWRERRQKIYDVHSVRLETLLHEIIDLAFTYEGDHVKFYLKFLETVNAKSLTKRGIIDPEALLGTSLDKSELSGMKRSDAEFLSLLSAGFSYRELTVIYGLKNLNSVYIKSHRLRGRLSKKMLQLLDRYSNQGGQDNQGDQGSEGNQGPGSQGQEKTGPGKISEA
jgi:hypothetical protein